MSGRGRPQQSENIRITKYEQTIHEFTNSEFKETGWK